MNINLSNKFSYISSWKLDKIVSNEKNFMNVELDSIIAIGR